MSTTTTTKTQAQAQSTKVVALPSMTHSLAHLPTMPTVDPRCLRYGGLGASKEASQAKLQQTLQRRDTGSACSSGHSHSQPAVQPPPRKTNDEDYLMMKGRKKPT